MSGQILQGKLVVITGAGAGLGRALARGAVARGAKVLAIGRDHASLTGTGVDLDPALYHSRTADVSDFATLEATIAEALAELGTPYAMFANAAVYPRLAITDQTAADFMGTLAVNVGGVVAAIRAVLPAMYRETKGRIFLLGSYADLNPIPESAAYATSKGAIHALARAVANEVGADYPDILVNEWIPGSLATQMGIPDGLDPATAAEWGLNLIRLPAGGPSGRIYLHDSLQEPPLSFKQKVKRKLGLG